MIGAVLKLKVLFALASLLAITRLNAQDAALQLESVPDGADLTLNGKFVGTAPATISIEPGSFRLVIQKNGFEPWVRDLALLAGSSQTLKAELRPVDPSKPPVPAQQDNQKALRVGSGVSPPQLVSKVDPSYSDLARAAAYNGTVVIQLVVGSDGVARDIRVIRGLGLGLDEKALEAVNQWTFQPGMKDGKPVNVMATVEVNFRLVADATKPYWRLRRATFQPPRKGTRPVLIKFSRPRSVPEAKPAFAKLEFEVDENGRVQNPRVLTDPTQPAGTDINPSSKKHLLAAAKLWRFTPAQEGGKAVSSTATFDFEWSAPDK